MTVEHPSADTCCSRVTSHQPPPPPPRHPRGCPLEVSAPLSSPLEARGALYSHPGLGFALMRNVINPEKRVKRDGLGGQQRLGEKRAAGQAGDATPRRRALGPDATLAAQSAVSRAERRTHGARARAQRAEGSWASGLGGASPGGGLQPEVAHGPSP